MIHHGDLFDVLPTFGAASLDACITDPPYGIGFMGREWDTFRPGAEQDRVLANREIDSENPNLKGRTRAPASSPSAVAYDRTLRGQREFQTWSERWAREVWRVLKPGGYLLVCGAPRSFHRMTVGVEDAGFEIRDCLSWLYGQGFPKSLNLGDGRGTALKPGWEPIILARKPVIGTVAANVLAYGTGALNIDACRIGDEQTITRAKTGMYGAGSAETMREQGFRPYAVDNRDYPATVNPPGRWPGNVALDEDAAAMLDEQSGELGTSGNGDRAEAPGRRPGHFSEVGANTKGDSTPNGAMYGDSGGASRFYYVPKPAREERDYGCDALPEKQPTELTGRKPGSAGSLHGRAGTDRAARNYHPTVKPIELMRWLVKLITPPGGTVLDPFTGSGTTGMACRYEHRQFIGIEREAEYVEIATRRIAAVAPLFAELTP